MNTSDNNIAHSLIVSGNPIIRISLVVFVFNNKACVCGYLISFDSPKKFRSKEKKKLSQSISSIYTSNVF